MESAPAERSLDGLREATAHIHRRRLLRALPNHSPRGGAPAVTGADESGNGESDRSPERKYLHPLNRGPDGCIDWNRVSKRPYVEVIRSLLEMHGAAVVQR
jgi:hypothetical protein